MSIEQLENPIYSRYFINPDSNNVVFKAYKKAQESFWVEEEIDSELKKDSVQWSDVKDDVKKLIINQIAFFLIGDGRVNQTISDHIDSRITDKEVQVWYNFQKMMEDIHNIVYVKLADTYVTDLMERKKLFDTVENYPAIKIMIQWIEKWLGEGNDLHKLDKDTINELNLIKKNITNPDLLNLSIFKKLDNHRPSLARQLLVNIIMEGLLFQASFAIIFWFNHQYGLLPGLTKANEFISRDEGTHTDFGILLYNLRIMIKESSQVVHQMFSEATNILINHMSVGLGNGFPGMNLNLMSDYLKFVADQLLVKLRYEKLYNVSNPFKFMEKQSISVRISDFFIDQNVSEYGHHASGTVSEDHELNFDEDF